MFRSPAMVEVQLIRNDRWSKVPTPKTKDRKVKFVINEGLLFCWKKCQNIKCCLFGRFCIFCGGKSKKVKKGFFVPEEPTSTWMQYSTVCTIRKRAVEKCSKIRYWIWDESIQLRYGAYLGWTYQGMNCTKLQLPLHSRWRSFSFVVISWLARWRCVFPMRRCALVPVLLASVQILCFLRFEITKRKN